MYHTNIIEVSTFLWNVHLVPERLVEGSVVRKASLRTSSHETESKNRLFRGRSQREEVFIALRWCQREYRHVFTLDRKLLVRLAAML